MLLSTITARLKELRNELQPGKKMHPFPTNHSLRKYFKTRCELAGMKPINIENLMGISDSYYRSTENDLLEDYLKCVDALTITDEKTLKMRVDDLTNKSKDNEYLVNAKLAEKEKQIEVLISKQNQFEQLLQSLVDSGQVKPSIKLV
jgi:hypothetical protein